MFQLSTMVLSMWVKWVVACYITIFGELFAIDRHREVSFVDCRVEIVCSKVLACNESLVVWWKLNMLLTQTPWNFEPAPKTRAGLWNTQWPRIRLYFCCAELEVVQIGICSNQTECDIVYQLPLTRSFLPTTLYSNPNTIKRFLHTYICLDIYSGTVGAAGLDI